MRRFDRSSWPEHGPHRELLDLLDDAHVRSGCRSARSVARSSRVPVAQVQLIARGTALPADEQQVRDLLAALGPTRPGTGDRAAALYGAARLEHDGTGPWTAGVPATPVPPSPAAAPAPRRSRLLLAAATVLVTAALVLGYAAGTGLLPG
ncbi:hypothetical protein [Pseudonocardia spirodelae]|uniref:Helix-turn-helix domain-containing protein n=1 Tax=Pseudonocardia spirodelae TaxID=3133431 RepID=A0ABU8T2U4_9PSEU